MEHPRSSFRGDVGSTTLSTISSTRDFHDIINLECNRADRYGRRFSLAIFEIGSTGDNSLVARQLARTLHNRFRKIDEVGWLNTRQVGVVLPYTAAEGAWKLAEDVCSLVASVSEPPPFTIHTYPSERWPATLMAGGWTRLAPFRWLLSLTTGKLIHNTSEFRSIMEMERDRADRNQHIFSLILFDVGAIEARNISPKTLVPELNHRLRITDAIGWYDRQHIGALLPYASYENASKVANSLYDSSTKIHAVYTYPSKWFSAGREASPSTRRAGPSIVELDESLSDRRTSGHDLAKNADAATDPDEDRRRVKAANKGFVPFFVTPIPPWKRTIDIGGALFGIAASIPIALPTMLAIKATSKGPVFFKQIRAGLGGRPFAFYKFRSMQVDAEKRKQELLALNERSGPAFKLTKDPRVTWVGGFIRRWSIDELPQFINVLKGDMSLVGPRPPTMDEVIKYYHWHDKRLEVKPGITCLWQVYARHESSFDDWVRLDIQYARSCSLRLDVKILLLTLPAVLSRRGAT